MQIEEENGNVNRDADNLKLQSKDDNVDLKKNIYANN